MITALCILIIGLILISWAADQFVVGASNLARILKVSPLTIGLTIVAIGTSAPEIFVAIASSYNNSTDIAIGNVLGSNIANITLVLGLCAAINPITLHSRILKKELPILLFVTISMWFILQDGTLTYFDGSILVIELIALLIWLMYQAKQQQEPDRNNLHTISLTRAFLLVGIGILLLPLSSHIIVKNAITVAQLAGMSELFIGLTIIAIGTSLPEIVTAIMAAKHNEHDLIIGNLIGSNLFNILLVIPFPAYLAPGKLNPAILQDTQITCMITFLLVILFYSRIRKRRLERWHGILLFGVYIGYLAFISWR